MAQPSVACYFNSRKRNAVEDPKQLRSSKVQLLENGDRQIQAVRKEVLLAEPSPRTKLIVDQLLVDGADLNAKVVTLKRNAAKSATKKPTTKTRTTTKKTKENGARGADLHELFEKMARHDETTVVEETTADPTELLRTPPSTPTKRTNAMDKVKEDADSLKEIKQKLSRSSRLAELRASMARLKEGAAKLDKIEQRTSKIPESPGLKAFKSIELEVTLSPQKIQSPEKAYLSPRKDTSARKNLLNLLSPTKNAVAVPSTASRRLFQDTKPSLALPYKYRTLAEIFRSIDTVAQIMFNRKETITFSKLKPAVEEMVKRNLHQRHLAQIKSIYPNAYNFKQEKLRVYGAGGKLERWELVLEPVLTKDSLTSDCLLNRRRFLYNVLIEKVKGYHHEFLQTLEPPVVVAQDKITRWHPEFDIEKVPDVETGELPQPPDEERFTTGKDVLEKARSMFNCNTRMEAALQRLEKAREEKPDGVPAEVKAPVSVLKGIPQALLEKVRQKQAAKALESMTRTDAKDKEVQLYSRLPEFARLTRNLFVTEKKSVLPLDIVLEKLGNSMRSHMPKSEIERHVRTLSKEAPLWLVFHNIRNSEYVKISKGTDLSTIIDKLDRLTKTKSGEI